MHLELGAKLNARSTRETEQRKNSHYGPQGRARTLQQKSRFATGQTAICAHRPTHTSLYAISFFVFSLICTMRYITNIHNAKLHNAKLRSRPVLCPSVLDLCPF